MLCTLLIHDFFPPFLLLQLHILTETLEYKAQIVQLTVDWEA